MQTFLLSISKLFLYYLYFYIPPLWLYGIFLEFLNKNANKGTALEALCNTINIPLSKSIAVGDEENDQHMIKMAGLGVAMGNARDSIKEIANYVTCSNNEHGVAKVIDKFILNR